MRIADLYKQKRPVVSLEIFPPKKDQGPESILDTLEAMTDLRPDFISVTYSAGGSGGSDITLDIAGIIKERYGVEALPHLTCIQSTPQAVEERLDKLLSKGLQNVMALRGDLPADGSLPPEGAYTYAKDLIAAIKARHPELCIGGAAYAEGHITCDSMEENLSHLRQKEEAGADFFVTQLFFDNEMFYRFHEAARKAGIKAPISAGVMPILGRSQIQKMIFMCGASLPSRIIRILNKYENDPDGLVKAGIEYSSEQLQGLAAHGADGLHIYSMNRPAIARGNLAAIRQGGAEAARV
ncbi:MAG TPA: methylenetetrahydrofolate reductase [Firmicutes bacterium]|nr:methylenetetrahydrofolate reductase [Bacillota bacterium]